MTASSDDNPTRRGKAGDRQARSQKARHIADELAALVQVSKALAGKLELDRVLGAALAVVARVAGAEGQSILLIDPDSGHMSFHVAAGPGAEAAKAVPLPPGEGICGHVARTGEPLIVNDAQNDPRLYRQVDQTTGVRTRNLLAVPIRSGDQTWGVLELLNKSDGGVFDKADLRLAGAAADQIALAMENAHLHGEIVREERMAAIGRTVSGLAHCIKNILTGIRSGAAVINRSMDAGQFEEVRRGWQVVSHNNETLSNLVLDMLSLARDTAVKPFPADVNDIGEQICELMSERAAERGITLNFTADRALDEVMLDAMRFYRCLLNLLTNAIDACAEGGCVRVRLTKAPGKSRFTASVTDNGQGITKADAARLFNEFFSTKGGKGTGLGLPVTKKLVTEMGGTVRFHSVSGKGTRFVIALPVESPTTM